VDITRLILYIIIIYYYIHATKHVVSSSLYFACCLPVVVGTPPLPDTVEGVYPTVVTQARGRTVLVVQAYAWGKYMGVINVTFNDQYDVASWEGNPVLLAANMSKGLFVIFCVFYFRSIVYNWRTYWRYIGVDNMNKV